MKLIAFLIAVAFLTAGCHQLHSGSRFVHETYLVDATGSIKPEALSSALNAIEQRATALNHGDCITVIPIVGDSDSLSSELIIRRCVPLERQPYDQELTDFRSGVHQSLAELLIKLNRQHTTKTDILGAVKMADQEIGLDSPAVDHRMFIFSDLLEEDASLDFTRSSDLASTDSAEHLAQGLARNARTGCSRAGHLNNLNVFLGNLPSTELPNLPPLRRAAIQQFWIAYFSACNANPFFASDGPGMSSRFPPTER